MSIRELSIWRSLDCWSARSCWLWAWTASPFRSGSDSRIRVMFAEIEEIIGLALPPSCRKHPAHWSAYGRAPSTGRPGRWPVRYRRELGARGPRVDAARLVASGMRTDSWFGPP